MMSNPFARFDLTGKTAVVTGGSTGLGYNMTRALMKSGAKVLISARTERALQEATDKLNAEGWPGEVIYQTVDLSDRASVEAFAKSAIELLGGVDIFMGNAANYLPQTVDTVDFDLYDQTFQVNLAANFALTKAFLPHMRAQRWGRVIYSSSAGSMVGSDIDGMSVYAASKGALNSFVKTAAAETGHDGITVNSIVIGIYRTPMMEASIEDLAAREGAAAVKEFNDAYASMMCNGRLARSDEIEGVVQLLASDAGSNITGSSLVADGGMTVKSRPSPPPENPVFPPNS